MSVTNQVTPGLAGTDWPRQETKTRSAEGLGGPRPSSLGLALTIRIWGPGQSPAGAQRRTERTHHPAPDRDVHEARRTKATKSPARYRDVQEARRPGGG